MELTTHLKRLLGQARTGRSGNRSEPRFRFARWYGGLRGASAPRGPDWLEAFTFPADLARASFARRRIAALAEREGLAGQPLFDFLLAVGEALANAVTHGSPFHEYDEVTVRFGRFEGFVVVEVIDRGAGFGSSSVAQPGELDGSGRGIPFMRLLVDELRFECGNGGTTVRLLKAI